MAITKIVTSANIEAKNIGDVGTLATNYKNDIVGAINELAGGLPVPNIKNEPGQPGFGVGIAPKKYLDKYQMTPMPDYGNPTSMNFGNYKDKNGSIMVYIPKHYIKITPDLTKAHYGGNKIEISTTAKTGFWLPRAFVNKGKEIDGIFVDKYLCSIQGGIPISVRGANPLVMNTYVEATQATWSITACIGVENRKPAYDKRTYSADTKDWRRSSMGLMACRVGRGKEYSPISTFTMTMLHNLAQAHYQACVDNSTLSLCQWANGNSFAGSFIKGNTTNIGSIDSSVKYAKADVNAQHNLGKTGSVADSVLGKVSHNGQANGVIDLVGNQWHQSYGYMQIYGKEYCLKESVDIAELTYDNVGDPSLYDEIRSPDDIAVGTTSSTWKFKYFKPNATWWSTNADRTSNEYKLRECGIPINSAALQDAVDASQYKTFIWRGSRDNTGDYKDHIVFNWIGSSFWDAYFASCHLDWDGADINGGLRCCVVPTE